jgi:release factor glutamine methyltransferase
MDQSRITPERLTLIQSDVFESIDKKKKFDVIFWNFPFGMSDGKEKEMSAIRRGCTDPEYKSLKKLLV